MTLGYIVKDDKGNSGQVIPLVQGESRTISLFFFNQDGSPFSYPGTLSEIVAKVYSNINQASIKKRLSMTQVTPITQAGANASNMVGIQFSLAAADTAQMAANNSGLPMSVIVTDSGSNILELDFPSIFNVQPPLIQI